jgi:putative acetyltransferase
MLTIKRALVSNSDFKKLVYEVDEDLSNRYIDYYQKFGSQNDLDAGTFVTIAYVDDFLAGCAALRPMQDNSCMELKRMFVRKDFKKKGISKVLLEQLESWAQQSGCKSILLETSINQPEAISLYETNDYIITESYGEYVTIPECICMKKNI